ncbi:histone deacetylase [Thermodesulfomicrobium sp. WS]|uniref:histone deacetylase family protein n=1 Tax=Thermodesulfomicrobium sp. WS TaxID=3004129 RepID=UPI00248F8CC4|nr:histone deacetylase [Thermodesulfomicrobium sp. WS]BDV01980.1 histone deacetylase [Thermodesulfomicrobium sp. WS]
MLRASHSLGVIFFPAYDWSISPTHPEREERLLYTQDQFREEGVFDIEGIGEYRPLVASPEDIARVHFCFPSVEAVTTHSHHISAGGAIRAAGLVLDKERERAFAIVRPPGHHAMRCVHGSRGFCNINIEAIMVEWIRERMGNVRVAIVDTDCHHGDGTQDIYWHDPDTLFISLHQDGRTLYPGTGFPAECGGPKALGRTINIPLPPRTSDAGYLMAVEGIVKPILDHFKPDIIINSAGQDNHYSDPITNMNFTAQGYARLTELLGPHIAVLEGGYAIKGALPYVNLGIALALAGVDYSAVREPDLDPERIREHQSTLDYIKALCDHLPQVYFEPTQREEVEREGRFFVRRRSIFYDTDGITENQIERLRDCPYCPGWLHVESASDRVPKSLGIHVPIQGCDNCVDEADALFRKAQADSSFAHVQLIDRVRKRIRHAR